MIALQKKYFLKNKSTQELFEIFDLKSWKKRMPINQPKNVVKLAKMLHIANSDKLLHDWKPFYQQVIDSNIICNSQRDLLKGPEIVWATILNGPNYDISIEIRQLIRHILVIPTGK